LQSWEKASSAKGCEPFGQFREGSGKPSFFKEREEASSSRYQGYDCNGLQQNLVNTEDGAFLLTDI